MPSRLAEPQEYNVLFNNFFFLFFFCELEMTGVHQGFPRVIECMLRKQDCIFRSLIFTCQLPCSFNDWPSVGKVKVRLPVYCKPFSL